MKIKNFLNSSLIALLALVALVMLASPAQADVGTINVGITNFSKAQTGYYGAAYATNVIPCDNTDNFDLIYTGSGSDSGTSAITISLAPCVDSSRTLLATNTTLSFVVTAAGATTVRYRTNFPASLVGSAGGFAVLQVTNANATCNMTNQSLIVVKKRFPR